MIELENVISGYQGKKCMQELAKSLRKMSLPSGKEKTQIQEETEKLGYTVQTKEFSKTTWPRVMSA